MNKKIGVTILGGGEFRKKDEWEKSLQNKLLNLGSPGLTIYFAI